MQIDSLSQQENKPPSLQTKETKIKNFITTFLTGLIIIGCVALAGTGIWMYILNKNLNETEQQLADLQKTQTQLQSQYQTLKSENEKLVNEIDQSKSELEKVNLDLSSTKADANGLKNQNKSLQARFVLAGKKAEILYLFFAAEKTTDILAINSLVKETKDQELLKEWNKTISSESFDQDANFLFYLINSIRDGLNAAGGEVIDLSG